jgi:hypothetical protein
MTLKNIFTFNRNYFLLFLLIFIIEIVIAKYVHDSFIRPFVGDSLVVVLMFAFLKFFLLIENKIIALGVLLFAFFVETMQYFNLIKILGLEHNKLMCIILGTTFAWEDFLAYTVGFFLCLCFFATPKEEISK